MTVQKKKSIAKAEVESPESAVKLYLLDANIPVHDPAAIIRFHEHDIFIPTVLLEELDGLKNVSGEVGRNSRQALQLIEQLQNLAGPDYDIKNGIPISLLSSVILSDSEQQIAPTGRLYFQDFSVPKLTDIFKKDSPDNEYIAVAHHLKTVLGKNVVIISNDRNMRVKARVLNIARQPYKNDQVVEDIQLLYRGTYELPDNFVATAEIIRTWKEADFQHYVITTTLGKDWRINEFLYSKNIVGTNVTEDQYMVLERDANTIHIRTIHDFTKTSIWGIFAKSREQNFALNALTDPDIDFVTLAGQAGSGKTLLALAAAIYCILEKNQYTEIIFTREIIPLGKDPGSLPGTEEKKMAPWLGGLYNNLEVLAESGEKKKGDAVTDKYMQKKKMPNPYIDNIVAIKSLSFMQGCSLLRRIFIVDETQNLTAKQAKELITRSGEGSKVIFLGNLAQTANPYLSATSSGLAHAVDRSKFYDHGSHITLIGVKRSRLAEFAANYM